MSVIARDLQAGAELAHINRMPFLGILCRIDAASDLAPTGSRGHRVIVTLEAVKEALSSLVGMGVNFSPQNFDSHKYRNKCAIITAAEINDKELWISGYIFSHDFPDVVRAIKDIDMGMSWEIYDAHIQDMRADVWIVEKLIFIGATFLIHERAAYKNSGVCV